MGLYAVSTPHITAEQKKAVEKLRPASLAKQDQKTERLSPPCQRGMKAEDRTVTLCEKKDLWVRSDQKSNRWKANEEAVTNMTGALRDHHEKLQKIQIRSKLDLGGKITPSEKQYLRRNEPDLYARVQQMDREQRIYEKKLRRCKTKAQRKQLIFNKTMSVLSGANVTRKAEAVQATDTNYTLARLSHLREGEKRSRYSTWA